jgi:hypothetical protein
LSDQLDLTMLLKQQKQLLDEFGDFREQLVVLTAICMRVEASVGSFTIEVRATHSRHDRLARRVTALDERMTELHNETTAAITELTALVRSKLP